MRAAGGRFAKGGHVPHLSGGAGGGEARLEKPKSYGKMKGDAENKAFSGDTENESASDGKREHMKRGGSCE